MFILREVYSMKTFMFRDNAVINTLMQVLLPDNRLAGATALFC